jgi:uncharacterized membrane protein
MLQKKLHTIIPRLALLTGFCFLIEAFRMLITLNLSYIFLPWNLLLAWVPLWLAIRMMDEKQPLKLAVYLAVWLVFFPNAPYIITDFLHLKPRPNCPFWYDTLLLYSYAFTGLLLGIFSALLVLKKMKDFFAPWKARGFMLFAMLLSGYGIYAGRFLRYNTWDLLTDPLQIGADTIVRLIHPASYPQTYGVTLMSGVLLTLVFFVFESFLLAD